MTPQQYSQEISAAADALRNGQAGHALDRLTALRNATSPEPFPWFLLAQAYQAVGNDDGENDALDNLLAEQPRHLGGLFLKGRLKARLGDSRAAGSFYRTALNVAAASDQQLPPGLAALAAEAEAFLDKSRDDYADFLISSIARHDIRPGNVSPRIDLSLDLLLGRKQLYLQQPSLFYFPGLPQREFYERDEFPWIARIEAMIPDMQAELHAALAENRPFNPYVRSTIDRPSPANPLLNDPSWGAYYFWEYGECISAHAEHAPATMAALALAPMPQIARRSPIALYSLLKPGTHIQPHHGMLNTRLICHIPLITNAESGLRVGSETRKWLPGKALIFDDSIEHEAWNRGQETRIVLLFEIWRPEINEDERNALTAIFEAINEYSPMPQDQG
ncbi:MAG: aspartyl/asparaginyl beta-hydroxylase domain-containing protein [Blastomonas sp.]